MYLYATTTTENTLLVSPLAIFHLYLLSVPYQQNSQWMLLCIFVCKKYLHQRNLLECSITSAYEILLSLLSVSGAVSIRLILLIGEHCALLRMRHCSRHFLHNLRPPSAFNELTMHPFMDFSLANSKLLRSCLPCHVPLRLFKLKFSKTSDRCLTNGN